MPGKISPGTAKWATTNAAGIAPSTMATFASLRFTDRWLLNAILPPAVELQSMGEQELQHPAGHLKSSRLVWTLPRKQPQPVRSQPVGESPHRHSVQIDRREQPITR